MPVEIRELIFRGSISGDSPNTDTEAPSEHPTSDQEGDTKFDPELVELCVEAVLRKLESKPFFR